MSDEKNTSFAGKPWFLAICLALGMIFFVLFVTGLASNFGKPQVSAHATTYIDHNITDFKVDIIKISWPNIFADKTIIYTRHYDLGTKGATEETKESIYISGGAYYSRPIGGPVDFISIDNAIISNYDGNFSDPEIFLNANKEFDRIKKELNADQLVKNYLTSSFK